VSRSRVAVVALIVGLLLTSGSANATRPVRLTAGFDPGARLGGASALNVELHVDARRRLSSPVTQVVVWFPRGLGLVSSGLGLATCRRPASEFAAVLVDGNPAGLAGCSPNAVMGYGSAIADVRLTDGQVIPETATLTILAGPVVDGRIGLVVFVDGQHPFAARLVYAGELRAGRGRFGGAIAFDVPAIPSIADLATVALTDLRLEIGSRKIRYYAHPASRIGPYHPDGIELPPSCPSRGLRFRVNLAFQNGTRATAGAAARCPRSRRR